MLISVIRAVILYCVVIFLIRLMGKRQIGELQPSELVVTILISEIASLPMQDNSIPVLNSVISLFILVSFEIITAALTLKSRKIRSLLQGNPVIVIKNGNIDVDALKKLRLTVNDLISALRQKDIFELSEVSFAIFETNGKLSVLLKPEYLTATANDLNLQPENKGMPYAVICDGEFSNADAKEIPISKEEIDRIITKKNTKIKDILLMTVNSDKSFKIIRKEKK